MDEQKKPVGRPQIYQGWQPEQTGRRRSRPVQRPQEERRKGEYRPLAVTEQPVKERQSVKAVENHSEEGEKAVQQKVIHVADMSQKKTQRLQETAEQNPIEHMKQSVEQKSKQFPQQPAEQKTQQFPQQPAEQKTQQFPQQPAEQRAKQFPQQPAEQKTKQFPQQPAKQREIQQEQKKTVQHQISAAEQKKMTAAKRRREQENEMKMRSLWGVFGILCVILIVAIVYEVILGHGVKETGAERMEDQRQEIVVDTEQNNIEILTPGGELVSEIKKREERRSLPRQTENEMETDNTQTEIVEAEGAQ